MPARVPIPCPVSRTVLREHDSVALNATQMLEFVATQWPSASRLRIHRTRGQLRHDRKQVLHTGRRHDLVESIGGFKAVLAGFVEGEEVRKLIDTDEEFRGAICCLAHDVAPRRDDRSEGISLVVENAGLHHESLSAPEGGDR